MHFKLIIGFFFLFFLFVLCGAGSALRAQIAFEKRIAIGNYCSGSSIVQTADGSYIIGGWYDVFDQSNGNGQFSHPQITKIDSNGIVLWSRGVANTNAFQSIEISSILALPGDTYIAAGRILQDYPAFSTLIARFDGEGNIAWIRSFDGFEINSAIATSDGGYAIAGGIQNAPMILKFDRNSVMEWSTVLQNKGGFNEINARAIAEFGDGSFVVDVFRIGFSSPGETNPVLSLIHLSPKGAIGWQREISTAEVSGHSMTKTSDGGFIQCFNSFNPLDEIDEITVSKFDSLGQGIWSTSMDPLESFQTGSVVEASNGDVIVAAIGQESGGMLFAYIDRNGDPKTIKEFSVQDRLVSGEAMITTADHGFAATGSFEGGFGSFPGLLAIKLDSNLNGCNMISRLFVGHEGTAFHDTVVFYDSAASLNFAPLLGGIPLSAAESDLCDGTWEFATSDNAFVIFPNPVSTGQRVSLSFDGVIAAGTYRLLIRDVLGKVLRQQTIVLTGTKETRIIELPPFPNGTYYFDLFDQAGNSRIRFAKLVKD